jgi:hypothetical protein
VLIELRHGANQLLDLTGRNVYVIRNRSSARSVAILSDIQECCADSDRSSGHKQPNRIGCSLETKLGEGNNRRQCTNHSNSVGQHRLNIMSINERVVLGSEPLQANRVLRKKREYRVKFR